MGAYTIHTQHTVTDRDRHLFTQQSWMDDVWGQALVHTQQTQSWMDGLGAGTSSHTTDTVMDGWSEAGTCPHTTHSHGQGQAPVHTTVTDG